MMYLTSFYHSSYLLTALSCEKDCYFSGGGGVVAGSWSLGHLGAFNPLFLHLSDGFMDVHKCIFKLFVYFLHLTLSISKF